MKKRIWDFLGDSLSGIIIGLFLGVAIYAFQISNWKDGLIGLGLVMFWGLREWRSYWRDRERRERKDK